MTRSLAHRCTWAALHRRWTNTWDRIGRPSPCLLCGGPDARHRVADALLGMYLAGETVATLADEYGRSPEDVAALVVTGLNAEQARAAARVPRGREPPQRPAPTSTTSTTEPGEA